jgi:hypothetical protein
VAEEIIDNMLKGELIPNALEKAIRELNKEDKNEYPTNIPPHPNLKYYANIHDKKSDPLDNARHVLKRVDKNRDKNESERFKNK